MLLLLILIMQVVSPIAIRRCYHFIVSYAGFTFDDPPESLIAGIPATITWHRKSDDPDDIYFERRNVVSQSSGNGDSIPSPSDTTQLQGTLTVTFPSAGKYLIEVVESQKNDVIGSSHSLTVASQASQNSESSISSSVSSSPSTTTTGSPLSLASSASNPLTTSTGATSQLTSASPRTTNSSAIGPKQSAYESIATFHCAIPDMSLRYYVSSVSSPINSVTTEQKPSADDPIISGSSVGVASSISSQPTAGAIAPNPSASPSNSDRNRIIIGATIGSLACLLLLVGIGIFFVKRRRIQPYVEILPYRNSIVSLSPPDDEEKNESNSPVLAGGMLWNRIRRESHSRIRGEIASARYPYLCLSMLKYVEAQENRKVLIERKYLKRRTKIREGRGIPSAVPGPLPADPGSASEQAGPDGEEVPPAALGVIETELRQLKTQVHQILSEREAEWVQDDPFDRPPSYAETTF
ncbi:uncharacterized protein ARMOST_21559 [Armillaria ostoyae]|uniref:GOLD domain-containing protein n=1 Tax=Armillaria ostoyae TaxID=47428 RepID=A0A284SAE6_ARMOS|nr:uncharacterized protein ARMOST_21559 [Armillaria ostoyae]